MIQTIKTHYHGNLGRILFCSGRHMDYAMTSNRLDDVTCGACRRKLIAQSKKVKAA